MTEPSPQRTEADPGSPSPGGAPTTAARERSRRWLLPALGIVLAILGAAALVAAALVPRGTAAPLATSTPVASARTGVQVPVPPGSTPSPPTASGSDTVPVGRLVDPTWVARVADEGKIPPRALSAYAGAALSVARTHPGCKIGWNTLAAIGKVESEHGTLNGSHLDDRGVATPTIVGIALDGTSTTRVADTDRGQYDGDSTWDRAVGPMQFVPSTWSQVGADGNGDGAKDVNQIDDAALAAAVHLCDVGGDLTVAANWVKAVGAYNDSVDYNNKVAQVATAYASLR